MLSKDSEWAALKFVTQELNRAISMDSTQDIKRLRMERERILARLNNNG